MAADSSDVYIEVQEGDISDIESQMETEPDTKEMPASTGITILIAGRSGSGKSTLVSNLLRKKTEMTMSPDSVTQQTELYKVMKNGVEITILDTKGLEPGRKEKARQLRGLPHAKEANLIIYCLPVSPGSRFNDGNNREMMKALQDTYGKTVWSHCILALTFSDLAQSHYALFQDNDTSKYMEYIEKFTARFQEGLNNLRNSEAIVKTPFKDRANPLSQDNTNTTIVAIPTGFDPRENDKTLPLKWQDMLFQEMLKKCSHDQIASLLQYQYGREEVIAILKNATMTGAKVGAAVGSTIPGIVVGGAIGGTVGVTVGGVAGAVMLAVDLGAKRNICSFFKVD